MTSTPAGRSSLRQVPIDVVAQLSSKPSQKIRTDEDLGTWQTTTGYRDFALFLRRLNESVVGHILPWSSPSPSQATLSTLSLLETLDKWIDDIPPLPTPQRFGNLAFRSWGKRLEDEHEKLLIMLLPPHMEAAVPHLAPYLLTSFGSFTRMDYGTGHETSFALFLLCLTLIRFFEPDPEVERQMVLIVFLRYVRLCWRLQDVYKLEPAGSHGVWGLDDYHFLGYIFGSAQLRDQKDIPVSAVIRPPLPPTNFYFLQISRILAVKQGPFFEHSSQLYSIATGVQLWSKVNSGLFKMYEAEVLGKRVVVQHIPLGGLLEWDPSDISPQAHGAQPAPISSSNILTATPYEPGAQATVYPGPLSPKEFSAAAAPIPWVPSQPNYSVTHIRDHSVPRKRATGLVVGNKVPLGPLASSALHPSPFTSVVKSAIPGPTTVNTPQTSLDGDVEAKID